jgi:hypothetical protein
MKLREMRTVNLQCPALGEPVLKSLPDASVLSREVFPLIKLVAPQQEGALT